MMNAGPTGRDKRVYERIRVSSLKNVWNLSEGGAYIATESPKRLGAKIHVELKLGATGNTLRAMAKVVRVLHRPNPKLGEPAGMALQFMDLEAQQLLYLQQYLSEVKIKADLFEDEGK
jgi:hypothetical protein